MALKSCTIQTKRYARRTDENRWKNTSSGLSRQNISHPYSPPTLFGCQFTCLHCTAICSRDTQCCMRSEILSQKNCEQAPCLNCMSGVFIIVDGREGKKRTDQKPWLSPFFILLQMNIRIQNMTAATAAATEASHFLRCFKYQCWQLVVSGDAGAACSTACYGLSDLRCFTSTKVQKYNDGHAISWKFVQNPCFGVKQGSWIPICHNLSLFLIWLCE